jgi:predicted nuclease of predicted toxin-antitoxin system
VRYLLDANLSPAIADELVDNGFDATHVADMDMLFATDEWIFALAARESFVVVTADSDFAMLLAVRRTDSPSIVLLREVAGFGPSIHSALLLANLRSV